MKKRVFLILLISKLISIKINENFQKNKIRQNYV